MSISLSLSLLKRYLCALEMRSQSLVVAVVVKETRKRCELTHELNITITTTTTTTTECDDNCDELLVYEPVGGQQQVAAGDNGRAEEAEEEATGSSFVTRRKQLSFIVRTCEICIITTPYSCYLSLPQQRAATGVALQSLLLTATTAINRCDDRCCSR